MEPRKSSAVRVRGSGPTASTAARGEASEEEAQGRVSEDQGRSVRMMRPPTLVLVPVAGADGGADGPAVAFSGGGLLPDGA